MGPAQVQTIRSGSLSDTPVIATGQGGPGVQGYLSVNRLKTQAPSDETPSTCDALPIGTAALLSHGRAKGLATYADMMLTLNGSVHRGGCSTMARMNHAL